MKFDKSVVASQLGIPRSSLARTWLHKEIIVDDGSNRKCLSCDRRSITLSSDRDAQTGMQIRTTGSGRLTERPEQ
jgi:hypothetical protein